MTAREEEEIIAWVRAQAEAYYDSAAGSESAAESLLVYARRAVADGYPCCQRLVTEAEEVIREEERQWAISSSQMEAEAAARDAAEEAAIARITGGLDRETVEALAVRACREPFDRTAHVRVTEHRLITSLRSKPGTDYNLVWEEGADCWTVTGGEFQDDGAAEKAEKWGIRNY